MVTPLALGGTAQREDKKHNKRKHEEPANDRPDAKKRKTPKDRAVDKKRKAEDSKGGDGKTGESRYNIARKEHPVSARLTTGSICFGFRDHEAAVGGTSASLCTSASQSDKYNL